MPLLVFSDGESHKENWKSTGFEEFICTCSMNLIKRIERWYKY